MVSHTSQALGRVTETVKGPSSSSWPFKVIPWTASSHSGLVRDGGKGKTWEQKGGRGVGKEEGTVRKGRDKATG